jgi:hypothetical protein
VTPRADAHPPDEVLAALLDEDETAPPAPGVDPAVRRHVSACPVCTRRLAELGALRRWLREGATREAAPSRDLAHRTLVRLRQRQAAVGGLNEMLATLAIFLRWMSGLLSGPPPAPDPERPGGAGAGGGSGA